MSDRIAEAEGIYSIAARWLGEGRRVVAATLVDTDGSSPLQPGATMLVDDGGAIEGSVTGGCVEGALVDEAAQVLRGGDARLVTYGISDSVAVGVGLMCGGTVHVFVHELDPDFGPALAELAGTIESRRPAAVATLLDGDHAGAKLILAEKTVHGGLRSSDRFDEAVVGAAEGCLASGRPEVRAFGLGGEVMGSERRAFIQPFSRPAKMVIFGAIDFSVAVAAFARRLGYQVTICDAREPFVRGSRFEVADEIVVDWPDRYLASQEIGHRDVILVFTHDSKFDEPALIAALDTEAGYIGALGSRRTQRDRRARLREAGISEAELDRVTAPCGLDIGARTPEETAISVLAEVVARSTGRLGEPLSETTGPIHEGKISVGDRT